MIHAKPKVEGLKVARNREDPWSRCQALAQVGYHCNDLISKNRILNDSFKAALETEEPNRIVTVSAWPLKVLCKSGQNDRLKVEVGRLLSIINEEPSPVRRAHALNEMLGAVLTGPRPLFWRVFDRFKSACLAPLENGKRNRRGESVFSRWVLVVDRFDPTRAKELLEAIGPILRERALAAISEHKDIETEEWCGWPYLT